MPKSGTIYKSEGKKFVKLIYSCTKSKQDVRPAVFEACFARNAMLATRY